MDFFRWVGENWALGDEQSGNFWGVVSSIKPFGFPGPDNIYQDGSPIIGGFLILTLVLFLIFKRIKSK